jgi:hypothetical protein
VERASRLGWRLLDIHADDAVAPPAQCRSDAGAKAASRPGHYARWHITPAGSSLPGWLETLSTASALRWAVGGHSSGGEKNIREIR